MSAAAGKASAGGPLGVAIVGCGRVGRKRAGALEGGRLIAVADRDETAAARLAAAHPGCAETRTWERVVDRDDVDAVIVSTSHDALAPITLAAVRAGKHVLVEKPGARSPAELRPVLEAARAARVTVKVGFNHRFHPALRQARALFDQGAIGPLLYLRGRYGHGGRRGYEREWRADPQVAGGGQLIDQGVHLIDLARWFAGDFAIASGHVATYFWDMPVEDNAFLSLRTADGKTAWLHASCTEWKNLFSFELFGRDGKLEVEGLGGSYGTERLALHRMLPGMGPPETRTWEYPAPDESWQLEFDDFRAAILARRPPLGTLDDALAALEIVEAIYAGRAR
ncbi:MAG TPA: Gfo/Idh/MocA family oxidoreductase [Vicinamibacteria bacterium]|nr:Gfo/Idh/MocA family oxidoreductase [Vicinamibacteria bacterium]